MTRRAGRQRSLFERPGDQYQTPDELFAPLEAEFGFQLDVCATPLNARCKRYLTSADDGLVQPWAPARCWMNPPYSHIDPWIEKANLEVRHGALVVALLPVWTDREWFHAGVLERGHEVRFLRGRVTFAGMPKHTMFPNMLVVMRPRGTILGPGVMP